MRTRNCERAYNPEPTDRWCPITSSLGEFPGYWDRLWYPGLPSVLVSIAFPFAFHISVFFHSLFTCHWISPVSLLYDRRISPIWSTLHLFTFFVSFQTWDWL